MATFCCQTIASAQDEQLARQYLENGEHEKAATLYLQLDAKFPGQDYFFQQYITSLTQGKNFAQAEIDLKKRIKIQPQNLQWLVAYGDVLQKQDKTPDAEKQYKKAIAGLTADPNQILVLKDVFTQRFKPEWALQVLERGDVLLKDKNYFAYYEADILRGMNDKKMVSRYLDALEHNETLEQALEQTFQRYFKDDEYTDLIAQLYTRIQAKPESNALSEILIWVLTQRRDFAGALRQVKALDRRLDENGSRVMTFALTTEHEDDFDAAIGAYQYLVEKGQNTPYFVEGQKGVLRCKRDRLTKGYKYTKPEIEELSANYAAFINQYGFNAINADMVREWAKLDVFFKNDLNQGIVLIDSLISLPRLQAKTAGEAKLELADYYLMDNQPWESTLLYSQVDKAFKEDDLGEMARYKNAKLSYYGGDFEWAQTQLKVLKASTSELISNDAIDLSVFIMDNLNLDTSATAMKMYATADLLAFQNRFDEAFLTLDSLAARYPKHSLEDDILYTKAQIYKKQFRYTEAAAALEKITTDFKDEIRADNALFELAELNETQFNNKEKAKQLYEKIITEHSGSTFIIEARKRFRLLRGDKNQ